MFSRWFSLTQLDGSVAQVSAFVHEAGFKGLVNAWPRPRAEVWQLLACVGLIQGLLQVFVPGKKFLGPVSPKGNVPVYKVSQTWLQASILVIKYMAKAASEVIFI